MCRRLLAIAVVLCWGAESLAAISDPTGVTGLRLWLDGNDLDGNGIAAGVGEAYGGTWKDKSGNSFNFSGGVTPPQLLGGLGGKDVLSFNGSTQFLTGPAVLAANDDNYTYFAVWKPNTNAGIHSVYEQAGVGNNARSAILAVNSSYGFNGESNDRHDLVPYAANVARLTDLQVNDAATNNIRLRDNGGLFVGKTSGAGSLNIGTAGATIGRKQQVNGEFLSGSLAEVVVYDRVLTAQEHADVNNYLNSKWSLGLTIPGTGTDSLMHRWSFTTGPNQANDSIGTANITGQSGTPTFAGNAVALDGTDFLTTSVIGNTISEKTFVAWVKNTDLNQPGGGAVMGLQNPGSVFDSLGYGEAAAGKWYAGSDFFNRTQNPQLFGAAETLTTELMLAIVYKDDNSIELYRDGALYGSYTKGSLVNFLAGSAFVNFGRRESGSTPEFDGIINEARIYGSALTQADIQRLFALGPDVLQTAVPEPNSVMLWSAMGLVGTWVAIRRRNRKSAA